MAAVSHYANPSEPCQFLHGQMRSRAGILRLMQVENPFCSTNYLLSDLWPEHRGGLVAVKSALITLICMEIDIDFCLYNHRATLKSFIINSLFCAPWFWSKKKKKEEEKKRHNKVWKSSENEFHQQDSRGGDIKNRKLKMFPTKQRKCDPCGALPWNTEHEI